MGLDTTYNIEETVNIVRAEGNLSKCLLDELSNYGRYHAWTPMEFSYISTGCTLRDYMGDDYCSTGCTIVGEFEYCKPVSKSIDTKKDVAMPHDTIDKRPVHIYFTKTTPATVATEEYKKLEPVLPNRIVCCGCWAEIAELFTLNAKSVCVSYHQLENQSLIEIVNMIETFSKLVKMDRAPTITLGVSKDTPYKIVKEAQKLNISGIIPMTQDYGLTETIKGCHAQWNNIPYWPRHIIDNLDGAKKQEPKLKFGSIRLTPRQEQILNLIKERGASNKVIAKTLNISESTVKLHVGMVLKKYGVKNRTQLALFSK